MTNSQTTLCKECGEPIKYNNGQGLVNHYCPPQTTNNYCVFDHERTEGGSYPSAYYRVKFFDNEAAARKNASECRNGKIQYIARILAIAEIETKMNIVEIEQ